MFASDCFIILENMRIEGVAFCSFYVRNEAQNENELWKILFLYSSYDLFHCPNKLILMIFIPEKILKLF